MTTARRATAALIIPALNEDAVIGQMLAGIPPDLYDRIVVADNGSTDRTAEVARANGASVVHAPDRGYGAACLKAIDSLPDFIDIVVFMQADASEDPRDAPRLIAPLLDGRADLVLGSRTLGTAEPGALLPHQAFGNHVATTLIRWIYGHQYTDLGPYRAITIAALRRLNMRDRNYGWTVEMQVRALQCGLKVLEIPVACSVRKAGENKISGNLRASLRAGWKIITTVIRLAIRA